MSNRYPPGMSARDYDHVEGPLYEGNTEGGSCLECESSSVYIDVYRVQVVVGCMMCGWQRGVKSEAEAMEVIGVVFEGGNDD